MLRFLRIGGVAAFALALASPAATVSAQPSQPPIRIIAGYAPGGNVDLLARVFAQRLGDALGRTVIVENKPGGGGQIAAEMLKAAPPDGNMLMLAPDAAAVVRPAAMKHAPFDAPTDFVAVAETGSQDYGFAINSSIPAKDLREFALWAKAHPLDANVGSAGVGGITHFSILMVGQAIGVPLVHVPYNGSGPAVNAAVAGQIAGTIQPVGTLAAQAQAGRIRVLAVTGNKRSDVFPSVPTFTELGYPSLNIVTWFGMFAPAKTPPDVVKRYNEVFNQAMNDPAVKGPMTTLGLDTRTLTPQQFGAIVKTDADRWNTVIKASGFTLDSE